MCFVFGFATIDFMNLEYISQQKLQRQIKRIFKHYLPRGGYRLFFFGSRVKGDNFPRSDIDLGIDANNPLSAETKLEIEEELQNLPILYKIDLVDFGKVSKDFKKSALKYSELIN